MYQFIFKIFTFIPLNIYSNFHLFPMIVVVFHDFIVISLIFTLKLNYLLQVSLFNWLVIITIFLFLQNFITMYDFPVIYLLDFIIIYAIKHVIPVFAFLLLTLVLLILNFKLTLIVVSFFSFKFAVFKLQKEIIIIFICYSFFNFIYR